MSGAPIGGSVAPGFERVRDAFARAIGEQELGAAVSAYLDGEQVVDLWGGWMDAGRTRPWQRDTIVAVYSATKAMTATCAHRLVERGLLDLEAPVAAYWPEFAQAGKADVTVRMLLGHQAGLPWATAPYAPEQRFDWDTVTGALARSAPVWDPGTRSEYHGGTFGYLAGELVRRVDGRALPRFFREEIAEPLGADFLIAFGPEHDPRCAQLVGDDGGFDVNSRAWRAAGDGAATGHASADGLARVFGALARGGELDGVRVLEPRTIAAAAAEQPLARAGGVAESFGLGYELLWRRFPALPAGTFGHTGMGGSIGLADPAARLGFGYVMNRLFTDGAARLLVATYGAILGR